MLHNRFDLQRQYDQKDSQRVLARAMELQPKSGRFIGLGCGGGSIFHLVHDMNPELTLVGIEAGSKVHACNLNEFVRQTQQVSTDIQRPIYGVDRELLFKESNHVISTYHNNKITIVHIYDGGVFSKHSINNCIKACDQIPDHSIAIFVTSTILNTYNGDPRSDYKYIIHTMRSHGWVYKRKYDCRVREEKCNIYTMKAMYFKKKKKIWFCIGVIQNVNLIILKIPSYANFISAHDIGNMWLCVSLSLVLTQLLYLC